MDKKPPSDQSLRLWLLILDIVGLGIAFTTAYAVRLGSWDPTLAASGPVLVFSCINIFLLYLLNLYRLDAQTPFWQKPIQAVGAVFLAGCAIVLIAYLGGAIEFSGLIGRGVLIGAQTFFALWAATHRFWISKWLRTVSLLSRWLVLATPETLELFQRDLEKSRLAGQFHILLPSGAKADLIQGSLNHPDNKTPIPIQLKVTGTWNQLSEFLYQPWSGIIVGAPHAANSNVLDELMTARLRGVRVYDLADFYERTWYKVPVFYLQSSWFALSQGFDLLHNPIGLRIKRIIDITCSLLLLALTSPVLLLAVTAIRAEGRGPILFRQVRVGENGRHFTVLKLRSMRVDAEKDGAKWAAKNDSRITRVGAFIRATRIDELPQLINVLRGEMSFIGPRPERPEFTGMLEEQIPFYSLRHILKPGVTGWAQVMYPYGASVDDAKEKLQFELYYIKNYSLLLDVAIILKTIRVVVFGKGR